MRFNKRHPLFHGAVLAGALLAVLSVMTGRLPTEVAQAAWRRVTGSTPEPEPMPPVQGSVCAASLPVNDVPDDVVKDPGHPDYDPIALREVRVSSESIFDGEPRAREWAPRMEQVIRDGVKDDLAHGAPTARLLSAECRTATCRIRIKSPAQDSGYAWRALQFTVWGERCHPLLHAIRTEAGETFMETICYSPKKARDLYLRSEKIREIRLSKARRMGSVHPLWHQVRS